MTHSKKGDKILLCKGDKLFWYYSDKKKREEVEIVGVPHMCQESLVSLGNDSKFDGNVGDPVKDDDGMRLLAHFAIAWNS